MPGEPHATECSNPGHDDRWTCPGCYEELGDIGIGRHDCPKCGRTLQTSVEMQPVCVTRLEDPNAKEDDDEG